LWLDSCSDFTKYGIKINSLRVKQLKITLRAISRFKPSRAFLEGFYTPEFCWLSTITAGFCYSRKLTRHFRLEMLTFGMTENSISFPIDLEPEGLRLTETHVYTDDNTAFGLHRVTEIKDHKVVMRSICETRRATRVAVTKLVLLSGLALWFSRWLDPKLNAAIIGILCVWMGFGFYKRYVQHRTVQTLGVVVDNQLCYLCTPESSIRANEIKSILQTAIGQAQQIAQARGF
jgi:hypothetical protein